MKQQTEQIQRKLGNNGYIYLKIGNRWVQEHRFIVENYIKRKLLPEEVIHHLNENKKDNRIENLMIFPNQKEHQKFHYKLKRYGYLTNPIKRQIQERWKDHARTA